MVVGILIAAIHTAITVMVHATIAHIQLVHHVNNAHDNLWIVGGIAVDFDIENMTATRHLVIRSLDFGLMSRTTFIINGHMVRISIVIAVGDAGDDAELLAVTLGKLTTQAFGRCCKHGLVMMIALAEVVDALSHIAHNLQS